jgi:hypothetical protein
MAFLITGGSIIQGSIPGHGAAVGNLEAVIGRQRDDGRFDPQHYWRVQNQSRPDTPWELGGIVTQVANGPGWLTQRREARGTKGNFEVVVPEAEGLVHYWLDNSRSGLRPWNRVGIIAPGSAGPGAIVENRLNGNLEALALHQTTLVHYSQERTS